MKYYLVLFAFLIACGPGQKGTRLQELERMLQDPDAALVKQAPGGKRIYQDARKFRRLSLESWDAGNMSRSEEYALLGWLKYRTAVAIYEQYQAKDRLEEANAKVLASNPEIASVNNEEIKLSAEITRLEDRVSFLKRQKAAKNTGARKMVINTKQIKSESDSQSLSVFNQELRKVEAARVKADKVNAKVHQSQMYAKANNLLKSLHAEVSRNNNVTSAMMRRAKHATAYFENATRDSQSGYKEELSKQDPVKRQRTLINVLTTLFGESKVAVEANAVRLIFPSSFVSGGASINTVLEAQLKKLIAVVERFDDFSINVEGFTEKGDPTDNLGLSQLRARRVKEYLKSNTKKKGMLNYSGRGQENLRYSISVENNRVEFVFSHSL